MEGLGRAEAGGGRIVAGREGCLGCGWDEDGMKIDR